MNLPSELQALVLSFFWQVMKHCPFELIDSLPFYNLYGFMHGACRCCLGRADNIRILHMDTEQYIKEI